MDALGDAAAHRGHKRSNSRVKIAKKKKKDLERKGIFEQQAKHNPKAFSFSGGRRAVHRRVQHASEVEEKRLRRPRIFKAAEVPPPFTVVVQGPVGVGKSTLIQSLVKHYAKRNVAAITGPITLVSSKTRRLTFIECGNSMVDMLDCCKIADLVLVMIDGSFGYEMETLEFLNIMQTHGFPRVAAVVTHLEGFPDNSTLRKAKKRLKNRFWSELYDGAKMLYLNGLKYGRYKKNEIVNVARAIASQKPVVISWRQSHFYCICLRHEVLEDDKTQELDNTKKGGGRSVHFEGDFDKSGKNTETVKASFYGYVYGSRLLNKQAVHIPGAGDFIIDSVTNMDDPCPVQTEGRTLKDKNRNIYAPECDVGNVMLDDDAMYIELARAKEHFTETPDEAPIQSEAVKMVRDLQKSEGALLSQIKSYKFNVVGTEDDSDAAEDDDSDDESDANGQEDSDEDDNESDEDDEEEDESEYEEDDIIQSDNMVNGRKQNDKPKGSGYDSASDSDGYNNLSDLGSDDDVDESADLEDNELVYKVANIDEPGDSESDSVYTDSEDEEENGQNENEKLEYLTDDIASKVYGETPKSVPSKRNVTGGPVIGEGRRNPDDAPDLDFVDFARLDDSKFQMEWTEDELAEIRAECFQNYTDETDDTETVQHVDLENEKVARMEEAEQKRLYNEALSLASVGNVGQFVRITITGLPAAFFKHYEKDRGHPIIIGGLQMGEQSAGYLQIKLRKHRWAPRVLKTNDPLLFSVGWRRFQSLPVYCMDERNQARIKMLKYTPEHMHCLANIYGPLAPPSFAVVAIKDWSRIPQYRISATGIVVGTNQDFAIKKKLKVQGYPYKILKNTAFIKDMFTSELEVIKCLGSRIVTASGIRGEIKKPVDKAGAFRATFEDKILLSDMVLLKAFITVRTKRFFNPMVDWDEFRRVRTMAELRTSSGINPDSVYEPKALLRRPARRFNAIKIPKPIIDNLPFSSRPKVYEVDQDPNKVTMGHSEYERSVANVMQRLLTIRKSRLEKRKADREKHLAAKKIEEMKREAASKEKLKGVKKLRYMKQGKAEAAKRAKMCLD